MRKLIFLLLLLLAAAPGFAQVAVTLSPMPRLQFFDANGSPCSGCLLYSYAAGSSTPLATYLDSTGTTQNSNPITLDSMGSASVWLKGSAYKLALTTAEGSPLFTVDNIRPADTTYLRLDGTNGPMTGPVTFSGALTFTGGGSLAGTWTGSPIFSGEPSFTGAVTFTGSPQFNTFTSLTTNPAATGSLRFASSDMACWRNNANSADVCLKKNATDELTAAAFADFIAPAFVSSAANPAAAGLVRMASGDSACWRNAANNADICLAHDSTDDLTYNGNVLSKATPTVPLRYSSTTPASVTDSNSTTTLQSITYQPGDLNLAGRTLHVFAGLDLVNNTGATRSAVVAMYIGSTLFASTSVSVIDGASEPINLDFWGVVMTTGATGGMDWNYSTLVGTDSNTGSSGAAGPTTIDTTSGQTISIKVTLLLASADLTMFQHVMVAVIQ